MRLKKIFQLIIIICVLSSLGQFSMAQMAMRPFSNTSPWNHPIERNAVYKEVKEMVGISLGLNYNEWTCGFYTAKNSDGTGTLYFQNDMWNILKHGVNIGKMYYKVYNDSNLPIVEAYLRANAHPLPYRPNTTIPWPANFYSTITPGSSDPSWPKAVVLQASKAYFSNTFYIPEGAVPSPDVDGLIAILQPNGMTLDCINAVVCSNGDIVCSMASYVDTSGEGTGLSNGRRASLIPSFAGLIRDGEISSGDIKHALVCLMSATVLKEEALWPAFAWDTNAGYTGSLPMGALLAIPRDINIESIGLTANGKCLAKALQNYGVYVADRGGPGGMSLLAELNARDLRWSGWLQDLNIIIPYLKWVVNNSPLNRGGGGEKR